MNQIDRVAIVVKPKEPYFAWARTIDQDSPIDEWPASDSGAVYLAEVSDAYKPGKVLWQHFAAIFEERLEWRHREKTTWPTDRHYGKFREWFDVELIGLVLDPGKVPPPRLNVLTLPNPEVP